MRSSTSRFRSAASAAMLLTLGSAIAASQPAPLRHPVAELGGLMPRWPRVRTSKKYQPNGERECARRRRQFLTGHCQVSGV